jgi:hypothetical protein
LCHNCNTSLGLLNEDVKIFEKCIEYLKTIWLYFVMSDGKTC